MCKVIFIDSIGGLDHLSIKNRSIGGTEYQFYNLIRLLSEKIGLDIECCNKRKNNEIIENINYFNLENIDASYESKIVLLRHPEKQILQKIKKSKKIIFWRHGLCSKKYAEENQEILINTITDFVFPSDYAKNQFLDYNKTIKKAHVISNILYEEDFVEAKNSFLPKKNQIVFASAWHKGLYSIVDLFKKINKNKEFEFIFMCPGYGLHDFENQKKYIKSNLGDNAKILEKQDKRNYSKIIKESLCVFAPIFNETFGCVFAESLYLGTAVLYDETTKALEPLVGNLTKCNYKDDASVYEKILFIKNNKIEFNLSELFLLDYNIKLWQKMLKE